MISISSILNEMFLPCFFLDEMDEMDDRVKFLHFLHVKLFHPFRPFLPSIHHENSWMLDVRRTLTIQVA